MGCDIHLYVERRTHAGWEHVPDSSDVYDDPRRWFHQRNYDLFSILADVRNGYGFQSISPPRGLPVNASVEVQAESERWGVDGHSHSHLTLAEVLSFDWDQEMLPGQPYHRCVSGDWWATVARASRLAGGNLHAVRFVFWFDS